MGAERNPRYWKQPEERRLRRSWSLLNKTRPLARLLTVRDEPGRGREHVVSDFMSDIAAVDFVPDAVLFQERFVRRHLFGGVPLIARAGPDQHARPLHRRHALQPRRHITADG